MSLVINVVQYNVTQLLRAGFTWAHRVPGSAGAAASHREPQSHMRAPSTRLCVTTALSQCRPHCPVVSSPNTSDAAS